MYWSFTLCLCAFFFQTDRQPVIFAEIDTLLVSGRLTVVVSSQDTTSKPPLLFRQGVSKFLSTKMETDTDAFVETGGDFQTLKRTGD